MPIYYSQNCIQTTQKKLNKYMKKIENHYLRDRLKYKYIKKFYIILKNKKSMISSSSLHQDIISFIKNDSLTHTRFIGNYRPSNTKLLRIIPEIMEVLIESYVSRGSRDSSDNDSSSESRTTSDDDDVTISSSSSEY